MRRCLEDAPIGAELTAVLENLLQQNADGPLALFFLGRAAAQQGDNERAKSLWRRLQATVPDGAPFNASLDEMIAELEETADQK